MKKIVYLLIKFDLGNKLHKLPMYYLSLIIFFYNCNIILAYVNVYKPDIFYLSLADLFNAGDFSGG